MFKSVAHSRLHWRGALAALVGLVLLAPSCSDTTNVAAIPHAKGCLSEADCDRGLTCTKRPDAQGGLCHVDCTSSDSCAIGERCVHSESTSTVCLPAVEAVCVYDSDCFVPLICGPDQKCRDRCKNAYDCIKPQDCVVTVNQFGVAQRVCAEPNEVNADGELITPFDFGPDGGRISPDGGGGTGGLSSGGSGGTSKPSGASGGADSITNAGAGAGAGAGSVVADAGDGGAGGEPSVTPGPRPNPCTVDSSTCNPLEVVLAGSGKGRVTSDPVGLNCGTTCNAKFPTSRAVVLSAIADQDSVFNGWSGGGCTGDRLCVVTPNAAPTITATFSTIGAVVRWTKEQPKVTAPEAAFDRDGNVIVTGSNTVPVELGGPSASEPGVFVVKYTSAGSYVWGRHFSGSLIPPPSLVTSDANGDVILAGRGYLTIGSGSDQVACDGTNGLMIAKFAAADGTRIWAKCYPPNVFTGDYEFALAAASNGDLVVAVSIRDSNLAFLRISGSGELKWSKFFSTSGGLAVNRSGLALDKDGNIFLGGWLGAGTDLGSGPIAAAGGLDGFVSKWTDAGVLKWLRTFGDTQNDFAIGLATDAQNGVVFTGRFSGQLDFPGHAPLTSAGGEDVVAGKYSADGKLVWVNRFGTPQNESANYVLALPNGDFLLGGGSHSSLDPDEGGPLVPLNAPGKQDLFLLQLSGVDGKPVIAKGYGSPEDDGLGRVSIDANGDLLLSATAGAPIDFGGGPTASAGSFYVKMKL
jgi:Divergent InlB B-repeat domain